MIDNQRITAPNAPDTITIPAEQTVLPTDLWVPFYNLKQTHSPEQVKKAIKRGNLASLSSSKKVSLPQKL